MLICLITLINDSLQDPGYFKYAEFKEKTKEVKHKRTENDDGASNIWKPRPFTSSCP